MTSVDEAPPTYDAAIGRSSRIPPERRRSMEDEMRPLPEGWLRQYDPTSEHQFYVDTTKEPPRSIWHHPYDDDEYLKSLPASEREHVTRLHRSVSLKDIAHESSDEEDYASTSAPKLTTHTPATPGPSTAAGTSSQPTGLKKFGRGLKDKITNTTHVEREKERRQRDKEEEEAYKLHMAYRRAFTAAMRTGQPQLLGTDQQGRQIYIEPPNGPMPINARVAPGGDGMIGYNPYVQGPYSNNANARYIRPEYPYQRPYGYGYGSGFGFPLMGGLLGGAMLGGLMF